MISFALGGALVSSFDGMRTLILVLSFLVYGLPTITLGIMLGTYFIPYRACKKYIPNYERLIDENLTDKNKLSPVSADNSVMANDSVLFFPNQYCVIPFAMIESYKFKNVMNLEPDVYIKLTNGKTVLILNKNFDDIKNAIDAYKNNV